MIITDTHFTYMCSLKLSIILPWLCEGMAELKKALYSHHLFLLSFSVISIRKKPWILDKFMLFEEKTHLCGALILLKFTILEWIQGQHGLALNPQ